MPTPEQDGANPLHISEQALSECLAETKSLIDASYLQGKEDMKREVWEKIENNYDDAVDYMRVRLRREPTDREIYAMVQGRLHVLSLVSTN